MHLNWESSVSTLEYSFSVFRTVGQIRASLRFNDFAQCIFAVHGSTFGSQTAVAGAGRHSDDLDDLHDVLSGRTFCWILLRSLFAIVFQADELLVDSLL